VNTQHRLVLALIAASLALAACSEPNTGDGTSGASGAAATTVAAGIDRFLLFPDPIVLSDGSFETVSNAYADAYYRAIDPNNDRDTLARWKAANGFGSGAGAEHLAVFRDVKDLGYGRRMTGRLNSDGSVAFVVENYNVTGVPGGGYSSLNVEAAIVQDSTWHIGTNAIEWSASPCTPGVDPADCKSDVKFAKYYNFSAATGERQLAVDLDGKGMKAMPGPCITCHGGRGDPLTPADASTGKPRFALVENSLSRKRGDTEGRLQGLNVDSFEFSGREGWQRSKQEAVLKDFNQWVLCTYPLPAASALPEDQCRVAAGVNEWQGGATEIVKAWYGGDGMPNANFTDNYVPAGWNTNAPLPGTSLTDKTLYQQVVAPYCRTCHAVRGTANQSDMDFTTLAKFQGYADRIKVNVFDRGNMPLALIVHQDFWESSAPATLAAYIDSVLGAGSATASGVTLQPGRPVANPGPDRMVRTNANAILSAADSLFATGYSWSVVSGPASATITNPTARVATFIAAVAGQYTVRLTVSDGTRNDSKNVVITVDDSFPDPSALKFAHVKNVLQNLSTCTTCHKVTPLPQAANTPPIWYTNFDRNGDSAADTTDDAWLRKELLGRVNLTDVSASPLLRKPSGNHHAGLTLFDPSTAAGLSSYSILYNWILAGAPAGGVVANAGANSANAVTFSGAPLSAAIALDGAQSIGPAGATLSYAWSIVSGPSGPSGAAASITSPTAASTTLNVTNVGTYVVQLQVSGGGYNDTAQRTITVSENPITASFTPANASNVPVAALPAAVTLTNTSTGGATTCQWTIVSGAGASITSPNSCTTAALNVPALGAYQVNLSVSNISSSNTTHIINVTSGTPVGASIVVNGGTTPVSRSFTGGTPSSGTASTATVALNGTGSTGVVPLTYSWSVTAQPDSINGAASLSSTTSSAPTLTVRATGSYTVRLTITDAALNTTFTTSSFSVTPARGTTFSAMSGLFASIGCTNCHSYALGATNPDPANSSGFAPSWANENDSNGKTQWKRVFQRVDLVTSTSSLLLLNPSSNSTSPNTNGHGGGCQPGFNVWGEAAGAATHFCADTSSANYTTFRNWILDGAPPGN
jgi:mono/diheme cytochrome c family protein